MTKPAAPLPAEPAEPAGGGSVLPRPAWRLRDEQWMRRAIAVARATPDCDVPVGAVVVGPDGAVVATGVNRREADSDPLAHAEVLALREAAAVVRDGWRLEQCTLVVTLEPCVMCAGAAVMARVGRIVFGAWSEKTGACGSMVDVVREPAHSFIPQLSGGVLAEECAQLLPEFFRGRRGGASKPPCE
ncbi:tRNA adenosine(34) deaminase TadA [Corynebacterium sp. TAE3-ERU12]|uniref:tRNA adenosine(34) deaminase TadA n=1 Tax=Corynebacterium sp. TAE3-ERU12 TaxID=2849491 RepID=UPI00351CCB7F